MKIFNLATCLSALIALGVSANTINKNFDVKDVNKTPHYYQNQLVTENSKKIYNALEFLLKEGKFFEGDYTLNLTKEGYLENKEYVQSSLMSDFVAARDSFRFDHPETYYVDFSKLTLRQTQKGSDYRVTLGIGRDETYLQDGFNKENVKEAHNLVTKKVDEIVTLANKEESNIDKLNVVYESIMSSAVYKTELTANSDTKNFVRTPFGVLNKGEALCEGFATTTKMILDKLGYTSVLVQGMFSYEDKTELHMWNYIQMEDSRWYILDTTMDNGLNEDGTTRNYFLKNGNDTISTEYLPDGNVSVTSSNSFVLRYPTLSSVPYEENASYFTFENEGDKKYASYLGMGIRAAMNKGKYILYSYDTENMTSGWRYFAQSQAVTYILTGNTPTLSDFDSADKFDITLLGDQKVVFAVTNVEPTYSFEEIVENKYIKQEYYSYNGDIKDIYHYSSVKGTIPVTKSRPYVTNKTHNGISLEENKEYQVKIDYSEKLKKVYQDEKIEIVGSSLLGNIETKDIKRDQNTSNSITFTFTTKESYYRNLNYFFEIKNLIGESSLEAPLEASYSVVKNPEFACPKVEGAINTVYTNTPALISDGDLSSENWVDKDGNKLNNLPFKLALVASKPSEEKSSEMTQKIEETGEKVLKSSTFELNLQLCNAQVGFLNGNKLKVLMPFPEGYGPENKGVSFKAYHFKDDGTPELIESVITEHGLIIYVDAFSPFAIVVSEGEDTSKNASIQINGHAKADKQFIKLDKGESQDVIITLEEDNVLDYVLLNGKSIKVDNNKIKVSYDDLNEFGNLIEINTLLKTIKEKETNDGYHSTEIEADKPNEETPNTPNDESKDDNTIIIITISVTAILIVISGIVCFIAYKKKKQTKN